MSHAVTPMDYDSDSDGKATSCGIEVPVIDTPPCLTIASQELSPLMQLPAEIRLMILRELLLSSKPIAERKVYIKQRFQPPSEAPLRNAKGQFLGKSTTMSSGYRLTPAILSVCQLLLREGWPILYEENTLAIQVYSGPRPHNGRGCLRCFGPICIFIYALDAKCMFEEPRCPRLTTPARALITRFKKLHIDLNAQCGTSVQRSEHYKLSTNMVSKINPFLTDSCLQLAIIGWSSAQSSSRLRGQLKIFQLLRCKEFKIFGTSLMDGASNDIEHAATIKAIESIVTSDCPISNYHELAQEFRSEIDWLEDFYKMKGDGLGLAWLDSARFEIEDAGMDQNSGKFFQLRAEILGRLHEGVAKLE